MVCHRSSSNLFRYTTLFRSVGPQKMLITSPLGFDPTPYHTNLYFGIRERLSTPGIVREVRPSGENRDRKSTRLNSSHVRISYAVFCLQKNNYYNLTLLI